MTTNSENSTTISRQPLFTSNYHIYINHTDAGGIVYHANHLVFFENCRRDWFTKLNLSGYFLQTDTGDIQHFVVSQAQLQYRKAILLDEIIEVRIDKVELKPASIVFYQSIHRQLPTQHTSGEDNPKNSPQARTVTLLSSAKIVIACVQNELDPNKSKPLDADNFLADNSQTLANTAPTTSIKPVRVPKSLQDVIKHAIDEHNARL